MTNEEKKNNAREEKKSFELLCKEMTGMLKDVRYKGYRFLLESKMAVCQARRDNLRNTAKTNDEYLREALVLETEIALMKEILETPDMFVKHLNEIIEKEKKEREG